MSFTFPLDCSVKTEPNGWLSFWGPFEPTEKGSPKWVCRDHRFFGGSLQRNTGYPKPGTLRPLLQVRATPADCPGEAGPRPGGGGGAVRHHRVDAQEPTTWRSPPRRFRRGAGDFVKRDDVTRHRGILDFRFGTIIQSQCWPGLVNTTTRCP